MWTEGLDIRLPSRATMCVERKGAATQASIPNVFSLIVQEH